MRYRLVLFLLFCSFLLTASAQVQFYPPLQPTIFVIEGSPEGRVFMEVGILIVDRNSGILWQKRTTRAVNTGWVDVSAGTGGGGGGGTNYNFSADFTVTGDTNIAINSMSIVTNLPAGTAVGADDLFLMVNDFSGTPTAQQVTAALIKAFVDNDVPLDITGTSIDPSSGNKIFSKNLTANTTFTFTGLTNGQSWTVIITNGASWTATWPTVTWPGSVTAPILDAGAGAVNIYSFLQSGGRTFGSVIQADITTSLGWAGQLTDETGTGLAVFNTNAVLVTPTIASFANSTHTHLNAAGGGTLTSAALVSLPATLIIAGSDETTAITATADKVKFRMPYAMTVTSVKCSLSTAQASGTIFTVDIHETGTTILSTKLTIDNTATTSVGAATPAVISDAALADNAQISIDVDQIGDGTAKGLKVTLLGTRLP